MGKALSTDRNTKSPLEIKISTEENSNHRGVDLRTESRSRRSLRMGKLFRREREVCFDDRHNRSSWTD
jgi:hypothetical protein